MKDPNQSLAEAALGMLRLRQKKRNGSTDASPEGSRVGSEKFFDQLLLRDRSSKHGQDHNARAAE